MPTESTGFWILAVIASILIGLSKGGFSVVGMLGVPIMALVISPVAAAGLLLPVYVVSDAFGLYAYRRGFDRRILALMLPWAILGVAIGWATAAVVPEWLVTGLVGLIGASFAANLILQRKDGRAGRPLRPAAGRFWGTVTGFTSFVSHSGAPPFQVFVLPLKLDKTAFAATSTVMFAIVNAVKLVPYWQLGQLSAGNLRLAAVLLVPASLAVLVGVRLVRVIPQRAFFGFVTWTLLAVSIKLLWDALRGSGLVG